VKSLKTRILFLIFSAILMPALIVQGHVSAQAAASSKPLKISPVKTQLTVKPGSTVKVSTFITNTTAQPTEYKVVENDFVAGDEKGTPSIILDEKSYAPTHSLKHFMQPIGNVSVPAGATTQVDVTIKVPANAQAGGYFGAVRFVPASSSLGGNLGVNASAASLILVTVPGALVEKVELTNFDIQQDGNSSSNFRSPDRLSLLVRFQNNGNVQVAPFGQINVLKGKKKVYSYDFNNQDNKDNVLPDSARRWNVPLKNLGKFGKYTVTGNFTYGTTNQSIEIKKTVWIVPTTYIYAAIGAIVGLVLLVLLIRGLLKSYKKKILRQSGRK
jgi:hypothetical protein